MAPQVDETLNGKKIIPMSSTASSPQGETSIATPTSKPNYLKPTISSSGIEARNNVKKQLDQAQVVSTRPARAAMERLPSSSFKHPQKAPSSISTKEKPLLRARSANQRSTTPVSPKAASDAATKSTRGGKPQTPTKQWVLKKEATSHVKAPAALTASDSTTPDNDNLSQTSDQQGRPDHLMDVEGSEKGDQGHSEEHEPTREPTEEVKEEPEIKDVGEVIQNTTNHDDTKEKVDETHETGNAMQESEENPSSEMFDEEIAQENKQEKPIDEEKILGTAGSSEEAAPAPDRSNVEKASVEGEENKGNAKDEVEVPDLKPEPEKEVVKKKPTPENGVVRKAAAGGKTDAPVYNEVIEETVSKLAEKRKNRVLALAGAFETVISLHEAEAQAPKYRD